MKRFAPVILFVIAILGWNQFYGGGDTLERVRSADSGPVATYSEWRSGEQVQGQGVVIRLLSDDNEGSRHQRFIVRLKTGQTLLIAHNIEIAPRVSSLQKGDTISFDGEYEWNDKGGVIHWTHRDPQRHHQPGWIKHDGRLYQ